MDGGVRQAVERMAPLTSLRFLAAGTVVAYHAAGQALLPSGWLTWSLPGQAVSVFFVLSGFVLQLNHRGLRGMSAPRFIALRLARIGPLYFAVTLALFALLPVAVAYGDPRLILSLTSAWSADPMTYFWPADAPLWSISVELVFYLAFPLVTAAVACRPWWAILCAVMWLAVDFAVRAPADQAARFADFYINPTARLPEFVSGMAAAEALAFLRRLRWAGWVWTAAEIASLGAIVGLNMAVAARLAWLRDVAGANAAEWARGAGCASAAVAAILVLAVGRGAASRLLRRQPLVFLGEASFALYLVHWPLMSLHYSWGGGEYVVACLVVAALLHLTIERPAMSFAKTRLAVHR